MEEKYSILDKINTPEDLQVLSEKDMPELASQIRAFLVENVNRTGGHLASNLGVVELSIALHRVFSTPKDHIIWDVGHQSYVHKILTGRKDSFSHLRQIGGISGFTRREESEHDAFGAGHSSTSISAALGFAEADKLKGSDAYTVAVIGDGAFTGGMVHEALNNIKKDLRLIIILNENEMSISKNIGGFAKYMSHIRTSRRYFQTKNRTISFLRKMPLLGKPLFSLIKKVKQWIKNSLYASNYFEELGLFYLGPADGNDYATVERVLREAKNKGESVVIHLKTKKGLGYSPAEIQPDLFHSVYVNKKQGETFHEAFGDELAKLAEKDNRICAITAAMADGTGLNNFAKKYPDRFFDVGIAEEHALTFAAGLAADGMKPYFAVYSTFLQRGYDNLLHDIALQKLPVCICADRAGLAKSDGATHHGIFDVSFVSHIPEFSIYAPAALSSLREILKKSVDMSVPTLIRYPNSTDDAEITATFYPKGDYENFGIRCDFSTDDELDSIIISYGSIVKEAINAKKQLNTENIKAGLILLEKLKPYDIIAKELSLVLPKKKCGIVFLEEGIYYGGAGMLLRDELLRLDRGKEFAQAENYSILAIKDNFAIPCENTDYYSYCHISARDIIEEIKRKK